MSTVRGILGQSAPNATTEANLYTVPSGKSSVVKVVCCNRGTSGLVRVSVSVDGGATANKDYVVYDESVSANDTKSTTPITIGGSDVVRVYASTANFSFTCTGIEQDEIA